MTSDKILSFLNPK